MSSYNAPPAAPASHDLSARFAWRVLAVAAVALFCSVPASGQSMGTNYSDIWLVVVNQPYTDSDGIYTWESPARPGLTCSRAK
jgi:hypothetical protein